MSDELTLEQHEEHVGVALRRARESMGLQQADVAKELRLSLQTIKDIEAHDFRQSHALTYVKGYLRGYARMVELPAEDIIEHFSQSDWAQQQISLRQPKQQAKTSPYASTKTPKQRRQHKNLARWIGLSLLGLLLALVVVWWQGQKNQPHLQIHNKPLLALPEQHLPLTVASKPAPTPLKVSKPIKS